MKLSQQYTRKFINVCLLFMVMWLSGCVRFGTFTVEQASPATIPGLNSEVWIVVGDAETDFARDVRIYLRSLDVNLPDTVLAEVSYIREGERIPFTHRSQRYELEAVNFIDHWTDTDEAFFFLHQLPQ